MKLNRPFLLCCSAFLIFLSGACAHRESGKNPSRLQLIGADSIAAEEFPAIVKLLLEDQKGTYLGVCSGQFISPSTLLTAAHCFDDEAKAVLSLADRSVRPSQVFMHPRYQPFDPEATRFDLALLKFSDYRHPSELKLSPRAPGAGASVKLVSFGKERFTTKPGAGIGVKRKGEARIEAQSAGVLQLRYQPGSKDAAAAPGDSGGALLTSSGELAGVTSVGAPEGGGVLVSQYVDLTSPESAAFFRAARAENFALPLGLGEP